MVSRVYTPMVMPYSRAQGGQQGAVGSATDKEKQTFPRPQADELPAKPDNARHPSAGLQAVQTDRFQKIPLKAVLHDFQSTMDALGADEQTRSEVDTYLRVVSLQSGKERPEIPFIKHTLRTAAGTLDQFISRALGQPSSVVKEWVDALLLQDIDYHSPTEAPETPPSMPFNSLDVEGEQRDAPRKSETITSADANLPAKGADKGRLKHLVETAKIDQKNGRYAEADTLLAEALSLVEPPDSEGEPPPETAAWAGRLWHLRGRFADKAGYWERSVHAYREAATRFENANLPEKQAHALHSAASILEEHGKLSEAEQCYKTVLQLDKQLADKAGDIQPLARSLNDLGSLYIRQGKGQHAAELLQQATRFNELPPDVRSDLASNLAAAYRLQRDYDQSAQAYRQGLTDARTARDKERYTRILQQMASLFAEAGKPEQAMKALQHLKAMAGP